MKKIYCILVMAMMGFSARSQQQNATLPTIVPASPEASSVAKYVNYPVDYCTGLVKIEIPLYEIKTGDIVLPVTLSYHSSGLRVNENSGIVGAGWTLNAEPVITRAIDGLPDHGNYMTGNVSCQYSQDQLKYLLNGEMDGSPDKYYYKLLNNSGGFYFDRKCNNGTIQPVTVPYEPIKIQHNASYDTYTIIDESGLQYSFGFSGIENSTVPPWHNYTWATAFKADEILSAKTGKRVSFQYADATELVYNLADVVVVSDVTSGENVPVPELVNYGGMIGPFSYPIIAQTVNNDQKTLYDFDSQGNMINEGEVFADIYVTDNRNTTVYRKLISTIFSDNGDLSFIYTSDKRLSEIILVQNNTIPLRRVKFYQSLFNPYTDKWKLDSIRITNGQGTTIYERYKFSYKNPEQVRPVRSKNVDHWGYCNDIASFITYNSFKADASYTACAIPDHWISLNLRENQAIPVSVGGVTREADEEYMQAGVLSSIRYPTGGYKQFYYEANRFNHSDAYGIAGGLRIEKIEDYDPVSGQRLIRRFRYGENENGFGFISHIPKPDDYMVQKTKYFLSGAIVRIRTYSSWSLQDLFRSTGAPVAYKYVTEYRESNEQSTRILYEYNVDGGSLSWSKDPYEPFAHFYHDFRYLYQLKQRSVFDNVKQDYTEINSYSYQSYLDGPSAYIRLRKAYCPDIYAYPYDPDTGGPQIFEFNDVVATGCMRKVGETTMKDGVTSYKEYMYGNTAHMYPTQIVTMNSDWAATVESFAYPQDNLNLSGTALQGKNRLVSNRQINTLLQHKITRGSQSETVRTDYGELGNKAVPTVVKTAKNDVFEDRVVYHSHDSRGNPTCLSYAGGTPITYLWGYKYEYPVAKIENATLAQVEAVLSAATIQALAEKTAPTVQDINLLTQLRTLLPNAMIHIYTYKPHRGIEMEIDPNGKKIYYDYDSFGRLWKIRNDSEILQEYEYRYMKF